MNLDPAGRQTDRLPIPKTGLQGYQENVGPSPVRLRRLARSTGTASVSNDIDLSEIILELPLSDLAQFLPQHLAVRLYKFVQRLFEVEENAPFPCHLDKVVRNSSLLSALRSQLAHINNLTELIVAPPVILIDERQELFFYRSLPIPLRPISFRFLFLLAKMPAEFIRREDIYNHLWPGKMNYEGTNKPYERQISDHKCKLMAEIKKGDAGKAEIKAGELENLITTRHKRGYMLNCAKENVLILTKDLFLIVLTFFLDVDQFWADFLVDVSDLFDLI